MTVSHQGADVFEEHYDAILPCIDTALHRVMRRFWKWTERVDVEQELVVWCLKHPNKITEYLTDERTHSLIKALENAGIDYAQREKAAKSGYHNDDNYYWSKGSIEDMLPMLWSDEARLHPPSDGDDTGGRAKRPPNEGGNWIITLADLSLAFDKLDQRSKYVLFHVYGKDRTRVAVARSLEVSDTTVGDIISRAINKMHRGMGGDRPHPHNQDCECTGARKVMSNAQANAINDHNYEE